MNSEATESNEQQTEALYAPFVSGAKFGMIVALILVFIHQYKT